ncbi:MAG: PQQ-binding-like beta-propeller repeat protein, partial [FCB group bacterium]|nr:PQQ-binding-like beta-propeller repeat protein [FCB group bacterium]
FSAIVCVLLIANYVQIRAMDPLNNPELVELRHKLAESPAPDAELVEQIRALDLLSRKAFFTNQSQLTAGGYLLLGGLIVFLIALRLAARWDPPLPEPAPVEEPQAFWEAFVRAKERVAIVAIGFAAMALIAGQLSKSPIPSGTPAVAKAEDAKPAEVAKPAFPAWADLQTQWPSFRGPGGFGVAHFATAPRQWDVAAGTNVKWTAEIPLPGKNSPVVWDKKVFLSAADETTREVYCFDGDSGAVLWKKTVAPYPGAPEKAPKVNQDTGYAASTMVAHGDRVCAIFPNGDVVCFDFEGKELWGRNIGVPDNHYGHSSSLIALDNLLFVQMDDNKTPRLLALDMSTGAEAWSAQRKYVSWASPVLAPVGEGLQLVLVAEKDVDAYEPATGKLLWNLECIDGEIGPSPAFAKDIVFVAQDYAMASALKLDPAGAAPPAIAWEWDETLPDISSPLGTGTHFYIATSGGDLTSLDHATGEEKWTQTFDDGFSSSPVLVGDCVYLLDTAGVMHIFKDADAYEEVASIPFDGEGNATPAYLDGRIYARVGERLYCIAIDGS